MRSRTDSLQAREQLVAGIGLADVVVQGEANVPVLLRFGDSLAAAEDQRMCWREFLCAGKDGAGLRNVAQRKILFNRMGVEVAAQPRMDHQRLELRAEDEGPVWQGSVIEGLNADPVPCEK
jgi:hypothetical protein